MKKIVFFNKRTVNSNMEIISFLVIKTKLKWMEQLHLGYFGCSPKKKKKKEAKIAIKLKNS